METNKGVSFVQHKTRRNVPLCCLLREAGIDSKKGGPAKGLQWAAEEKLISKNHEEFNCYLPEGTRSTFLMVFSPDGKMIASTHGNHNVYVTDLTNGKNVKTLTGHPRTPWCIAFHPSSNQILASGCLGGQVRVWDLHGGSEIWTADSQTVIASLAFHPTDRVLVIASYNEIHFWDWSQQKPFAKCCTSNEREKVRYVAFDELGEKLVTGIANAPTRIQSQWDRVSAPQPPPQLSQAEHERRITICYRYMVEQYEQLVERYYRLSNGSGGSGSQPLARRNPPHTMDRGTDPMEPSEDRSQRCSACQRSNFTDNNEPGPSTATVQQLRPTNSINESTLTSSSEVTNEGGTAEPCQGSSQRTHLTVRANYLYERLARLRSQVETGRSILARTRTAAAAMSARMSPSAPEDANFLIDNFQTRHNSNRPVSDEAFNMLILPEPLVPTETTEDRPSFISRIGSFLTRRRNGVSRVSDSSSSETSISDNGSTWHRPLTPPPSYSQRLTNLISPTSRNVIFDPVSPESSPDCPPIPNGCPRHDPFSVQDSPSPSFPAPGYSNPHTTATTEPPTASHPPIPAWVQRPEMPPDNASPSSQSLSEPTNGSDSDADSVFLRQNIENSFSHWRVFLRYRYFRDSGSNTEPPSESNSSDSSNRLRRPCESSSAIARLRAQFRRLQSGYNTRDREPHLLRVATENAERRLLTRLSNLLQRPFPSTSSNDTSLQPPPGNTPDLASVRFGLQLLGRHIDNLSRQCSRVRLESGEMRRMWQELESQIFTLHRAVRDWPPVVRVSPGNQVDTEGVASTSSLPTDEESEDSGLMSTQRRHLGTRRFRFLHRPAYKRPRFDRHFRFPRRYQQGTSVDDDSDDNDDGNPSSRQSESSDADTPHGVKRKSMCDQSPSTSNDTPRTTTRISVRYRISGRPRFRPPLSFRPWHNPFREKVWPPREFSNSREMTEESTSARCRPGLSAAREASQRDAIRHRARHVLLLMVDSLTQFFENDTFTRSVSNETLQERISNLISLLELALNLTDLLLTQLDVSSRELGSRERRPGRSNDTATSSSSHAGHRSMPGRDSEPVRRRPTQQRRSSMNQAYEELLRRFSSRDENSTAGSRSSLPVLRVNDGPPPPDNPSNTLRESPPPAMPPTFRPRFLHPRYRLPAFVDDSSEDSSHDRNDLFFLRATSASMLLSDTPMAPHHRIQAWDFTKYALPEIHIADKNIVVSECKIHNDASVDISNDGKLLVSLLPSGRLSITTMLGVYSLQWESLGQCLYTTSFEQNAVSVSLSPTTRHLIVGLASRRVHFFHTDRQTIAQIFRLEGGKPSKNLPSKGRLVLVRELDMSRESTDFMSLNCIRWAPTPGEAFVYGDRKSVV